MDLDVEHIIVCGSFMRLMMPLIIKTIHGYNHSHETAYFRHNITFSPFILYHIANTPQNWKFQFVVVPVCYFVHILTKMV